MAALRRRPALGLAQQQTFFAHPLQDLGNDRFGLRSGTRTRHLDAGEAPFAKCFPDRGFQGPLKIG